MIKLPQKLDFNGQNSNLEPVCLPTSDDEGRTCYVTGWGLTSNNGEVSPVLKEAKASIQEDNICRTSLGSKMFNQEEVCASTLFGADAAANGDSGGPLQCQMANGVWVQIIKSDCSTLGLKLYTRMKKPYNVM